MAQLESKKGESNMDNIYLAKRNAVIAMLDYLNIEQLDEILSSYRDVVSKEMNKPVVQQTLTRAEAFKQMQEILKETNYFGHKEGYK